MKTRLLRIVWIASVLWLGLLVLIAISNFNDAWNKESLFSDLVPKLIEIGWPAVVGLICCYVLNGEIGWPQYKTIGIEKEPQSSNENLINSPTRMPEEEFLNHIEKSKNVLKQSLEDSKNRMLQQWRHESIGDLKKVEKIKEIIHKSEVVTATLHIIKQTYHWNSWINNQEGRWNPNDWIRERIKFPIEQRGHELSLPHLIPSTGETDASDYKLETCFGFIDENHKQISFFIYKYDSSYISSSGRLLIKVDDQLVLDIDVSQDNDDDYSIWRWYGNIEFCKPDVWISSIVNLSTEFEGHAEIEKAIAQIKIEKHQISTNLKSQED
jgi:hypothetical protein